ncbi:phosphoglycerate mutase family protein [Beauveria brongniartii RCEF 3172]|uniref:Phosphoglycerate mutase family protein n=1 Tax=Beauveria brongniartii RCEF 3172 TaxID=1081107 RepID=A0A166ZU37_9HYPO|nr:phosphoglycerate mutase family protein [Beauveria brongniartii RCEF 3172]
MGKWTFSVPEGYFDDCVSLAAQLPESRLTTRPLFALTSRAYPSDAANSDKPPWARFVDHVQALNREARDNVSYKIMFLTRHGQGFHNNHGDDTEARCFDALLTDVGIAQADALGAQWLATAGLPVPQSHYASPLTRCLQTAERYLLPLMSVRDGGGGGGGRPYRPTIIKEGLRERWTTHTANMRRPRAWIAARWPACDIEDGFSEEDLLGMTMRAEQRAETVTENQERVMRVMEDVFDEGDGAAEVVAWTFHSLTMRALMGGLGMVPFKVQPATTVAVLVRGEKKRQE